MPPKISAAVASNTPSRLASRSGATENDVSPSIERPTRLVTLQLVRPWAALGRLVVDADLLEADPARQTLEEAVALRQAAQRIGGARRQQPEVAGVLREFSAARPS